MSLVKALPAVALLILLSGCAGHAGGPASPSSSVAPSPSSAPTDEPTASQQPTSAPTPTESADAAPAITTAGYGDLRLGSPVPSGSALTSWDPDACAGRGDWVTASTYGAHDYQSYFVYTTQGTEGRVPDGDLVALLFFDPAIETRSGAHVGMTVDDLLALFPNITAHPSDYDTWYDVTDDIGRVAFDTWGEDVVHSISVTPRGIDPILTAGTDGFICGA